MATQTILCPSHAECGEAVTLDLGDFHATKATVGACSRLRNAGVLSYEVRKSAALGFQSVAVEGVRHAEGLVTLTG